ncbi:lytic murein transglycosylase [Shewanella inventionis]|uniref:Murein transglycosylase n=1 Tax=Shewanella inventionis TaxID=1738770 RepID=A0ABQ1J6L9_9GAMM|nr:lytic murein transglycosylase [Shewanella inventionis]MCL1157420.1 lytic murein transglycosylase [Shewanella inventionis]UAL42067.1 lytic murein transglycosylase [Shewanella inventionis]GGB58706.1 murein transglycosylase [Shewanella inventionis]
MILKIILSTLIYFLFSPLVIAKNSHHQFEDFLLSLQQQSISAGVSADLAKRHISEIKTFKKANAANREQHSLDTYIPQAIPEITVSTGRTMLQQHDVLLSQLSQRYQVQPRFIIALWGVTSGFGEQSGKYPSLSVLASLAFKGENQSFYVNEFIAALKLIEQKQIPVSSLLSSSTGAMGQMQMMPTQVLRYAVDNDQDGKIDIWNSTEDAFATAANMLHQQGWQFDATWGRQVKPTMMLDPNLFGMESTHTFPQWQAYGIRRFNGASLPLRSDMNVSLIAPDGTQGRYYLVYDNFRLLHQFTSSFHDSLALTYLSEKIKQ